MTDTPPTRRPDAPPETAGTERHFVVASVDEVPPGGRKIVQIGGRSIGIFNLDGEYFAVHNACPHAGGALCEGVRSGFVSSSRPGQYDYLRRGEILRCPWHQWEFDIRTGRSWIDPNRVRVRSYETHVASGSELISRSDATEVIGDPRERQMLDAGLRPGPLVVETFPVRTTDDYIVLTI